MTNLSFILIAGFGAICIEGIHWFELRNKLDDPSTRTLLTSKYYWFITVLMIFISGVGTYLLFYEPNVKNSIPFVLGASFPLIFKKAVTALQSRDLGTTSGKVTFEKAVKAYFRT
jgi:hypothetical protein